MNNPARWKQRFENFEKAFAVFQRIINEYHKNTEQEVHQMALVQSFEVTHELSWKALKDYLENQGYDDVKNARQTIKRAFQEEIITHDAEVWMDSIQHRNRTSHIYDGEALGEILAFIDNAFKPSVIDLYHKLKSEL